MSGYLRSSYGLDDGSNDELALRDELDEHELGPDPYLVALAEAWRCPDCSTYRCLCDRIHVACRLTDEPHHLPTI